MKRYVTTITIIHAAESKQIATKDAEAMQRYITAELANHVYDNEIGAIRNVTIYKTQEAK